MGFVTSFMKIRDRTHRPLFRLGGATFAGTVGEAIFFLASIVAVLQAKGSSLSMSSLIILTLLPSILLAPFQGVFLDRFNIKILAVVSNILRALIVFFLMLVSWNRALPLHDLYLAIVGYYIVWYFMMPLSETMVTHVTDKEGLYVGMAILQGAWQTGALGSSFVAGFLLNAASLHLVFLIIAILDIFSAFLFWIIPFPLHQVQQTTNTHHFIFSLKKNVKTFHKDLSAGIRYMLSSKTLLILIVVSSAVFPFYQSLNTIIGPFNQNVLHGNSLSLGLIEGVFGIGSLLSAIFCVQFFKFRKYFLVFFISQILLLGVVIILTFATSVKIALIFFFGIGMFSGNMKVISKSLLTRLISKDYSGRVFSTSSFIGLIAGVFTALFTGLLAYHFTVLGFLVAIIIIMLSSFATLFLWKEFSRKNNLQFCKEVK